MKRIIYLVLSLVLILSTFSFGACINVNEQKAEKSVQIQYTDAPTIMQLLIDETLDYGLLPEPAATTLQKVKGREFTWKRLSLQDLYDNQTKSYPQAVLMVKNEVLQNYSQLVKEVKAKFEDNLTWAQENANLAVTAIKNNYQASTLNANVIDGTVIQNCKISWQDAIDAKDQVKEYIDNILAVNDSQVVAPAKKVGEDFFYLENGGEGQAVDGKEFTFYAPDGAPALAIAKFICDEQNFIEGATFNYNIVVADMIAKYMNGANDGKVLADFIVLPVNAASKMYNNAKANYKMVSVITHGNLYIMAKVKDGNTDIALSDLDGKKIGIIGQGNVPDLTFKTVLSKNSFSYTTIG